MISEKYMQSEFIELIEAAHKGQEYKGGVPYKHHLHRVAKLVKFLTNKNDEDCTIGLLQAALAHDVLEDTSLPKEKLKEFCDDETIEWIEALTCHEDCPPRPKYIAQMQEADEEVWVIKLADLYDNMTTACRRINENGVEWTKTWFLPVMEEQINAFANKTFVKYPKSGPQFRLWCEYALQTLKQEILRWS